MSHILIVYHSQQQGNTRKMAELVAEGCRQVKDTKVDLINVNEERVDIDLAEGVDGYALGSPDYFTYMAGGLKQFFDDMLIAAWGGKKIKGKPYVAFMTHGGGGGGIKSIEALAKALELVQVAPSATCKGAPEGPSAEKSIELGRKLAEHVAKKV